MIVCAVFFPFSVFAWAASVRSLTAVVAASIRSACFPAKTSRFVSPNAAPIPPAMLEATALANVARAASWV